MASLNIYYSMSKEDANRTSGTHTSLPANFLGLQNAILITSKCLLKLSFASDYSQYCGYTTPTPELSMTSWAWNLLCNFASRQLVAPTTQITTTSMQIGLPPSKFQTNKVQKTLRLGLNLHILLPLHDGCSITYETTPVYKSRWVAQMCCWFTAKTKYSTPEFKFDIQRMNMESCVEANRAF